jgi:Arc/MetJ-type ribon-helix-helix transcriptional regulator
VSYKPAPVGDEGGSLREAIGLISELDAHTPAELAKLLESSALEDRTRQVIEALVAFKPVIHQLHVAADLIGPAGVAVVLAGLTGHEQPRVTPGGAARKVSVSMPDDLTSAVQQRVGRGKFSQYVTEAVTRRLEQDLLTELSDMLTAEHGPVPEEYLAEARAEWPDAE